MNHLTLTSSCSELLGVGPHTAKRLAKLGLKTVQDLLFHFPFRYEDRTQVTPIKKLKIGEYALIAGTIEASKVVYGRKKNLICKLADATGAIWLRFLHFNANQEKLFTQSGLRLSCYGEIRLGAYGLEMIHPECRILKDHNPPAENTLTPVYPATLGLSQFLLRKLTAQCVEILAQHKNEIEYLPQEILQQLNLPYFVDALYNVHYAAKNLTPEEALARNNPFRQRLIFEELLAHQLSFLKFRQQIKKYAATAIKISEETTQQFLQQLPFPLTNAQKKVITEIFSDLEKDQPMLRLLQGDVGCGKTIVAASVLLQAAKNGYQSALMAPTELLAEQHCQNLKQWLEPLGITIAILTGKTKGKLRTETLQNIAHNKAQIIIGTHALFQEPVAFHNLSLVIIDEQHRFGVKQRLALWKKGEERYPHQLIMTATPIPRTLAMTLYADLDISTIDEMPQGRSPVNTILVSNKRRQEVIEKVRNYCKQGQVYWVCPLIEESDILQYKAAQTTAEELSLALRELNIGLIHGKMSSKNKELVMNEFKQGKIHILVATTVIEVGIDVKNANLIIIENAEKLGLVQLHQLRGRVGRGNEKGHCVLLYQNFLSNKSKQRLMVLKNFFDGFSIANKDLELRGAGELLGTKQTGLQNLKIADLICDVQLLSLVRNVAIALFRQHILAVNALIRRWLGDSEKYGAV